MQGMKNNKLWLFSCNAANCKARTQNAYYIDGNIQMFDIVGPYPIICEKCFVQKCKVPYNGIQINSLIQELEWIRAHLINLHATQLCLNIDIFPSQNEDSINILRALNFDKNILESQNNSAIFHSYYKQIQIYSKIRTSQVVLDELRGFLDHIRFQIKQSGIPNEIVQFVPKKLSLLNNKNLFLFATIVDNYLIQIFRHQDHAKLFVQELQNQKTLVTMELQSINKIKFRYSDELKLMVIFGNFLKIYLVTLSDDPQIQEFYFRFYTTTTTDIQIYQNFLIILLNDGQLYTVRLITLDGQSFQKIDIFDKTIFKCIQPMSNSDMFYSNLQKWDDLVLIQAQNLQRGELQRLNIRKGKIQTIISYEKVTPDYCSHIMIHETSKTIIMPRYFFSNELEQGFCMINLQCNKHVRKLLVGPYCAMQNEQYLSQNKLFYYEDKRVQIFDLMTGRRVLHLIVKDHFLVFKEKYKLSKIGKTILIWE